MSRRTILFIINTVMETKPAWFDQAVRLYDIGLAVNVIAGEVGANVGSVYKSLKRRGVWDRPPKKRLPVVVHKGVRYAIDEKGYYRATTYQRGSSPRRLHRVLYEESHGPIPEGHDVHHIDHDKTNNIDSNFELLSAKEHTHRHYQETGHGRFDPPDVVRGVGPTEEGMREGGHSPGTVEDRRLEVEECQELTHNHQPVTSSKSETRSC